MIVEKPFSGAVRWAINTKTGRSVWLVNIEMGIEVSHARGLERRILDALSRGEVWAVYDTVFRGYRNVKLSNLKTFRMKDEAEEEFIRRVEKLGVPEPESVEKLKIRKSLLTQHMGEIRIREWTIREKLARSLNTIASYF
ncbi:MAG: hypothetical protein QXG12_02205, partial [Thermoproteota archaeon]